MSFKFNLFPPQPQKSYYPKGQRDSTANSLFQLRENKKQQANQFQLRKDDGFGVIALPGGYKNIKVSKKNSNPRLFKKIGTSKTHNDGTGGRLRRLKARATTRSTPAPPKGTHNFGITAATNPPPPGVAVNIEPTLIGNYTVFKFTEASNLTIPASAAGGTIEYLLVGGGGAGGQAEFTTSASAGGGGAGGDIIFGTIENASATTYTIYVATETGAAVTVNVSKIDGQTPDANRGDAGSVGTNNGGDGGGTAGGLPAALTNGGIGGGGGAGYNTAGGNANIPENTGGKGGAGIDIGALGWEVSSTFVGAGGGGGGASGGGGGTVGGSGGEGAGDGAAINGAGTAEGLDAVTKGSGGGGAAEGGSAVNDTVGGDGAAGVVYIRYLSVF